MLNRHQAQVERKRSLDGIATKRRRATRVRKAPYQLGLVLADYRVDQ